MKTVAELSQAFAALDHPDDLQAYDKALRNWLQRHYMPPSETRGRVFVYDDARSVAVRVGSLAYSFGLSPFILDHLNRWLVEHMPEAVRRSKAGETFQIHAAALEDRTITIWADWARPQDETRVGKSIKANIESRLELGRFTVSSNLIVATLAALGQVAQ